MRGKHISVGRRLTALSTDIATVAIGQATAVHWLDLILNRLS